MDCFRIAFCSANAVRTYRKAKGNIAERSSIDRAEKLDKFGRLSELATMNENFREAKSPMTMTQTPLEKIGYMYAWSYRFRYVLFFMLMVGIGCNRRSNVHSESPPATPWFQEHASAAGLDFIHQRGPLRHWLPEIMGGGAAWLDYDLDGAMDLYLVQGGDLGSGTNKAGNALYRNRGDGTFENRTLQAGVGDTGYGMGAAIGDFNGDGYADIYVTNVGPNVLYQNRGDGTFVDVSAQAGVDHAGWGTAAIFVDYDQDDDVDLFLVNYIRWSPENEIDCRMGDNTRDYCSPITYQAPAIDVLYRNRGDGTFEDVSHEVGLTAAYGNGLGAVVGDFNSDHRLDFYVANDGMPNQLWVQNSLGHFNDEAMLRGCAVNGTGSAEAGMGVAAVDLGNDGGLDLFMTHLGKESNTLYVRRGDFFEDETSVMGLAAPSISYTGFGLAFADFDNDGQLDLYVGNGRVGRNNKLLVADNVFAEPNLLFRGSVDGTFNELLPQGGTWPTLIENSRAIACADYDHDGDVDIVIVNNGGPVRLLVNRAGDQNSWIRFRVVNHTGGLAVGAVVRIRVGDKIQQRVVGPSSGYLSSNEPTVHFGLGSRKQVDQIRVTWPSGVSEEFGAAAKNQCSVLRQNAGLDSQH